MRLTVTSIRARLNSRFPPLPEGLAEFLLEEEGIAGCLLSCCDSLEFVVFLDSATVEEGADDVCDSDFVFVVSSDVGVEVTPSFVVVELTSPC